MINKNVSSLIVIIIGFSISFLISINNLNKYDKNIKDSEGKFYHQMIKYDAYRYHTHGEKIKNQLKKGTDFFETGREHYTKYLPPRLIAFYYYLFDYDLFNENKELINTGIHLPYLVFQSFLYYFAIFLLLITLSKTVDNKVSFFIISFLSLEPTIIQYHSSFWSESIFFSLQIIIISLILKNKFTNYNFFLIGLFLALLSFQKEYSIFYIIPLLAYFFTFRKDLKIINLISLFIAFFLVQSILGYNNYKRSGSFYIMTADSKLNLHIDLVSKVMSKKFNMTGKQFAVFEGKTALKWINQNSINLDKDKMEKLKFKTFTAYRNYISEQDRIEFDNFFRNRTIKYFLDYPIDFLKFIIKSSIHITLLNPFHIYSDNNFRSGEIYYLTETHDKLVPYRIVYTFLVYLICTFGLYAIIKKKDFKIFLFLMISIIYFYGLVSWHGNTRYFMPVVIYLSFFFGYGVNSFLELKNQYTKK